MELQLHCTLHNKIASKSWESFLNILQQKKKICIRLILVGRNVAALEGVKGQCETLGSAAVLTISCDLGLDCQVDMVVTRYLIEKVLDPF